MSRDEQSSKSLSSEYKQAIAESLTLQWSAGWCRSQPRPSDLPHLPKFNNVQQRRLFMQEFFTRAIERLKSIDGGFTEQINKAVEQRNRNCRICWALCCLAIIIFPTGIYTTYRFRDAFHTTYTEDVYNDDTGERTPQRETFYGEWFLYVALSIAFLLLCRCCCRYDRLQDEQNEQNPLQLDQVVQAAPEDAALLTNLTTLCTAIAEEQPAVEALAEEKKGGEAGAVVAAEDLMPIPQAVSEYGALNGGGGGDIEQKVEVIVRVNLEVKLFAKPKALIHQCNAYLRVLREYETLGPEQKKAQDKLGKLQSQAAGGRATVARRDGGFQREGSMRQPLMAPIVYGYDQHGPEKTALRAKILQIDTQILKTEKLMDCGYGQILQKFLPTLGSEVAAAAEAERPRRLVVGGNEDVPVD